MKRESSGCAESAESQGTLEATADESDSLGDSK